MWEVLNKVIWPEKPKKTDAEYIEAMRGPTGRRRMLLELLYLGFMGSVMLGGILVYGWGVWLLVSLLIDDGVIGEFAESVKQVIGMSIYLAAGMGATAGMHIAISVFGIAVRRSSMNRSRPTKMLFKYYDLAKENGLLDEETTNEP